MGPGTCPLGRGFQQVCRFNPECFSYARQDKDARIPPSPLNAAHVGQVDLRREGKLFLSELRPLAELPHISSNNGPPIAHRAMDGDRAYIL